MINKLCTLWIIIQSVAFAQVYGSVPPTSTRYNDQYLGVNGLPNNGRYTTGDTRIYTKLASGSIVSTVNDGGGGQQVCVGGGNFGENVFVQSVSSDFLNETTLNAFHDYGNLECTTNNGSSCG